MSTPKIVKVYQVDAFTEQVFGGNPAAVCLVEEWLPETLMQSIATENNLSETAFVILQSDGLCHIRWFTPSTEVELCGHATLAAAFVVLSFFRPDMDSVRFVSRGGDLGVHKGEDGKRLYLNFPSLTAEPWEEMRDQMAMALNRSPQEIVVYRSLYDALVEVENEDTVMKVDPNWTALRVINVRGVIVTSRGTDADFVSRFFAPASGISEDPVCGSAHSVLVPFWSERLKKTKLFARQLSKRGGILYCEDLRNGRVEIGGHAVLYARGDILLPTCDNPTPSSSDCTPQASL